MQYYGTSEQLSFNENFWNIQVSRMIKQLQMKPYDDEEVLPV